MQSGSPPQPQPPPLPPPLPPRRGPGAPLPVASRATLQKKSSSSPPPPSPSYLQSNWPWIAGIGIFGSAVIGIIALVIAVRANDFHVRFCAASVAGWCYLTYVWLWCVVSRAMGHHPAWGLLAMTVLGAPVVLLLPAEDVGPVTGTRRAFAWIGGRHIGSMLGLYVLIVLGFWNSFDSLWVLDNLYIIRYDPRTRAQVFTQPRPELLLREPGVWNYFDQDYWWPKGISGLYRPLTSITYWINWTVIGKVGEDPFGFATAKLVRGFHVVNLILHWMNASLVYALAYVLIRRWGPAMIAGALFAIHPITTESVTNIIGRADLFAALAVIGGLLVWRRGMEARGWQTVWWGLLVMLIAAFGVFAKESSVAIGLVILVFDVVYRWHPAVAKSFGLLLLALLVPAFSGGNFAIMKLAPTDDWPRWLRLGLVAVIYVGAFVQHEMLFRRSGDPTLRRASIAITLVLSIFASLFHPWSGAALLVLLALYEVFTGPWLKDVFPDFAPLRWQAVGYTIAFVAFVFVPLGFGLALWLGNHNLVEQKLPGAIARWLESVHTTAMQVPTHIDFQRAGIIVGIGLLAWLWATAQSWITRLVVLVFLALAAVLAIVITHFDPAFDVDRRAAVRWPIIVCAVAVAVLAAVSLLLWIIDERRPRVRPVWFAIPVVLLAAAGASFYVFWAGFALTFLVGLIELVRGSAAPRILRESGTWHELIRRFFVGYYLLLPPMLAFFIVRFFIFNVQSTPPEEPFLDNPLRGGPDTPVPFWQSRMTAIKVMGKLIYLLIYPHHLASDYSHDQIPFFLESGAGFIENFKTIVALLTVAGMLALAVYSYRRNKPLSFFILFFFAAILPTSNILKLIGSIMAERFMYLPLVGFAGMVAILADIGARRLIEWIRAHSKPATAPRIRRLVRDEPVPLVPARGLICLGIPGVLLALLTYRTFLRNFDWRDDIRLWEAARVVSPRSFRCYQSLAFAYYEINPRYYIDKIIGIAEQGRPIVDPLTHDRNSSRLYLHLGMYYKLKGEMLGHTDERGNIIPTPEGRPWFEKSVQALERGVLVDRTFNRNNRKKQVERGDEPERIVDVGLSPVYMTLGTSYLRLGMYREAYNAFQYQRQLEPESAEPYLNLATVLMDMGRTDEAAVALVQALLLEPRRGDIWQSLARIYGLYGQQAQGSIILGADRQPRLNLDNPLVYDHLMQAHRSFITVFRMSNRAAMAEGIRRTAVYKYRMPAAFFDSLMTDPLPKVTPHGFEWSTDEDPPNARQ